MSWIDWSVLILTLAGITFYGLRKSRSSQDDSENFLIGDRNLKWYTIGLSIMATQASAITFLSTPGQAYTDGLRFIQFYFGMPIAMVILCVFVLPIFYKLKVFTAYEYLENRFDLRMRTMTAILFLTQRGIAAAISIYAPSLILSAMLGWPLGLTNCFMAIFVIIYTILGGSTAVSKTQELQMTIMLGGLVVAFFVILNQLPPDISLPDALHVAGKMGKTNAVSFEFNLKDRYNFWTGILGATFLFLSYFGTDQSQVGRYLSGKTLTESRLGLLFNGLLKVPMQFLVLSVGIMVFVFYQFNPSPIHFNETNRAKLTGAADTEMRALESQHDSIFQLKKPAISSLLAATKSGNETAIELAQNNLQLLENQDVTLRRSATTLIQKNIENAPKDTDYVFLNFVLNHLPVGLIGLMLAVIFCASWSTTASELSALATTSVVDIYRRSFVKDREDAHYLWAGKIATLIWGAFITIFATFARLPENLIQQINKIGSLFYGTILGIFMTAFFLKKIGSQAVFYAAIITGCLIAWLWWQDEVAFLWWNPIGCASVMIIASIFQLFFGAKKN
jgi:solute:Na+ symporter, SSS family